MTSRNLRRSCSCQTRERSSLCRVTGGGTRRGKNENSTRPAQSLISSPPTRGSHHNPQLPWEVWKFKGILCLVGCKQHLPLRRKERTRCSVDRLLGEVRRDEISTRRRSQRQDDGIGQDSSRNCKKTQMLALMIPNHWLFLTFLQPPCFWAQSALPLRRWSLSCRRPSWRRVGSARDG